MTNAAFWLCLRPQPAASTAEQMVEHARAACLLDTAQRACAAGFGEITIHTTVPELFAQARGVSLRRTNPDASIGTVVSEAASETAGPVCYAGAGMPAMTAEHWRDLRERIESGQSLANNLHSADFLGLPNAAPLAALQDEAVDNAFARRLRDEADLEITALERTAHTLLDLDTPADCAMLSLARQTGVLEIGPNLAAALDHWQSSLAPCRERLAAALDVLTEREQQLMVIGRVSATVWAALDRDTSARVRVISEERGLRSRAADGEQPRSLLGLHGAAVGGAALIDGLVELADAVIFDTRPLFAHLGWGASRSDRFSADLGDLDAIAEPPLRALVAAAVTAPAPIALGGHSLVSGGLLAAIDIAWTRREHRQDGLR